MNWNRAALSLLIPVVALSGPLPGDRDVATAPSAGAVEGDCTFAIRAKNNMSFDVWVMLYDSTVRYEDPWKPVLFRRDMPLKIQNHRIATGKTMDRRFTHGGSCSTRRTWIFHVRIGGRDLVKYVTRTSKGTGSGDRTIDLGESSRWGL